MTTFSERSHLRKLSADIQKYERNLAVARNKYNAFVDFLEKTGYDVASLLKEKDATSTTVAPSETATTIPKRGRSLRENISAVLSDGVARSATEVLAELKSQGLDPSSSDALSYVRTTLATHFKRVEGRRGYYWSPAPGVDTTRVSEDPDPVASFGKVPTKILQ